MFLGNCRFCVALLIILTALFIDVCTIIATPRATSSGNKSNKPTTQQLLNSYLELTALRHKILSENVANLNTPNYKANEVEMPKDCNALTEGNRYRNVTLKITSNKHIQNLRNQSKFVIDKLKDPYEIKPNGNNVSLPQQMTKLSQNQISYDATLKAHSALNGLIPAVLGK